MGLPNWSYEAEYLPSLEDLNNINNNWNWNKSDFIHHNPLWTPFQVLNKEFIEWLSNEIIKLTKLINSENINILEVWAWNWRLSYFLEKELTIEKVKKNINQIASDDFSWHEKDDPYIWVKKIKWISIENYDVEESIEKFKPNIIISSWMPDKTDWTKFFRKYKNLNSFILIWNPEQCWNFDSWQECDKFEREKLNLKWNISWQDNPNLWKNNDNESYSKIYLFKRKNTTN